MNIIDKIADTLHRGPKPGDPVTCRVCGTGHVRVLFGWPFQWRHPLRNPFEALCETCHKAQPALRGPWVPWIWWLPTEREITWEQFHDATSPEPVTCCGCGGWNGPSRFGVWGPEDGPDRWPEPRCAKCFAATRLRGGWVQGCTFADLGVVFERDDRDEFDRRAASAYPTRVPVVAVAELVGDET
jgi:hypothetical protein